MEYIYELQIGATILYHMILILILIPHVISHLGNSVNHRVQVQVQMQMDKVGLNASVSVCLTCSCPCPCTVTWEWVSESVAGEGG